ncbi:MAG TPA: SCO family protein [Candidatus Aquilonibacter sp.]|jgi:protein SCO1/2|nr:SCO family protein [Candidatus Aquilonibacter sp.]
MNRRDLLTCHVADKSRPAASLGPGYYSNGEFTTHEGKKVRFYDELIKGKISIINFMYASCDKYCPRSIACLAKVQDLLGDHLGRDMFMYSFTLKPDMDTPEKLAAYAKGNGARKGWYFLTGNEFDLTTIRFKLFRLDDPLLDFSVDVHASMLRIINDNNSHWSSWVLPDPPRLIREAISWVEPTKPFAERVKENAALQKQIDQEAVINGPQWAAYKRSRGWPEVTAKPENPEGVKKLETLLGRKVSGGGSWVRAALDRLGHAPARAES